MKVCSCCKLEKGVSEFYLQTKNKKPGSQCKVCSRVKKKVYKSKNPDKYKKYYQNRYKDKNQRHREQIKIKFGLEAEQYNKQLELQNNVCFICHGTDGIFRLAVDHHHETGKIRGLLCVHCNKALGCLRDNPLFLERAIKYLKSDGIWHETAFVPKKRTS